MPGCREERAETDRGLEGGPASHYTVALVDLDGRLPELERVARGLTRAQTFFGFTAAKRPTPRTAALSVGGMAQFYLDGVTDSFYRAIAPLKVEFAVCLTRAHIAFQERGRVVPNYLASESIKDERVMFVTHAGLRDYAAEAGVSLETAIAFMVTGQLVAYFLDMDYHKATRGCPMDFCDDLDDLVVGLRDGAFCPRCSKRLRRNSGLKASVEALLAWGRA